MVEKLVLIPDNVRGLGDVVSPKSVNDFVGYNSKVSSGTDSSLGTVYTSSYGSNTSVSMEYPVNITSDEESFTVTISAMNGSSPIVGSPVYLEVNGTVYNGMISNSSPYIASFTVPTDGSMVYCLKGYYVSQGNLASSFKTGTVYVVDDVDSVELFAEKSITQTGNSDLLLSRVKKQETPVRGATVTFYRFPGGDKAINPGYSDIWSLVNGTLQRTSSYSRLDLSESYTSCYASTDCTDNVSIELDAHIVGSRTAWFIIMGNNSLNTGLSLGQMGASFDVENWYHFRITIREGVVTATSGNYSYTSPTVLSDISWLRLGCNNGTSRVNFANLVIDRLED